MGQYWLEFPELLRKVKEPSDLHQVKKVHIESKASCISLMQTRKKGNDVKRYRIACTEDSKFTRLNSITPKLESRRVKVVRGSWNENFVFEVLSFPNVKHDDEMDVLFYAVNTLLGGTSKITWYM